MNRNDPTSTLRSGAGAAQTARNAPETHEDEAYRSMRGLVVAEFAAIVCLAGELLALAWLLS